MKRSVILIPVILILLGAGCTRQKEAGTIDLNRPWKFKPGDDLAWAQPATNDAHWAEINPDRTWDEQGYKDLDGYAWYRIRVLIPSKLKDQGAMKDSLQFLLGKIDDCDQVFFNGELIGENGHNVHGKVVPGNEFSKIWGAWDQPRRYVIAIDDPRIHWDGENVIAIRVYDSGGLGGLFDRPFSVGMTSLKDYLKFDFSGSAFVVTGDTLATRKFVVRNFSSQYDFSGILTVKVTAYDNGNILYQNDTLVVFKKLGREELRLSLRTSMKRPASVRVTFTEGASGAQVETALEIPYVLTPPVTPEPRINGARVFGVRPYAPFQFKVAATGEPPLKYYATNLPSTLRIDEETGRITGYLAKKGTYVVNLCVDNPRGHQERDLKIEVGDLISLTPPMGWNSWNCWGLSVSDDKVRRSARLMKQTGLVDHGWTYINIDDGWEDTHKDQNIVTNSKFSDMNTLCDFVHSLGLKIGIYSSPGSKTCGGYEGSYGFEEHDAKSYAAWGIDYLKYDWCSYSQVAPRPNLTQMKHPYKVMEKALRATGRDIHYSLCQYGMGDVWTWGPEVGGNSWRTTGDITDTWESMTGIGFSQGACSPFAGPGHWNDPDMLVVGWVGWGPALHYTNLSPGEQYTHITLWSMLAAPLLLGCDLNQLDAFTLNLLTNDEVLDVNQDPLGRQAVQVRANASYQVWKKEMSDSSMVFGLFNLTEEPMYVPLSLVSTGLRGPYRMRDLWTQGCLGQVEGYFEMNVLPHGARMIRLWKK
jgi:alpha-galactosidase